MTSNPIGFERMRELRAIARETRPVLSIAIAYERKKALREQQK